MWPLFSLYILSLFQLIQADGCTDTKPDFSAIGERISERKCREYNWERKQLEKCSKEAANTEFPYMGFLGYRKGETYWFLCGAFLVSPKFAVTPGHCVRVPLSKSLWIPEIVRFGNNNLDDNEPHVDIKIRNSYPFFLYHRDPLQFDIGLVELESAVPLTKSIYPGCVWWHETLEGVENTISPGWPKSGADKKNDKIISELKIHLLEPSVCFKRVKDRFRLLNTHICGNESISSIPSYMEPAPTGGSVMVAQSNLDAKPEDRMPFALGLSTFGMSIIGDETEELENVGFYIRIQNENFLTWIEQIVWYNNTKYPNDE